MKKTLIAVSAIALTFIGLTASAEAGRYIRYIAGYNHCGHPVYAYRYVPTSSYHRSSHNNCQPNYSTSHFRPSAYPTRSYHSYSRPSYRYSYSRGRSYCR